MLERIAASDFTPLIGQPHRLVLPDGSALAITIDSAREEPRARMPGAPEHQRTPFTVTLTALVPTGFIDGPCALELPSLGLVRNIWVGRMAALGRTANVDYFQIVFN